jgi:uncharacterized RDD family membrane protein YckC
MPSWTNNLTARGTMAGPAGVALADIPDRAIAYVIDAIIIGIVGYIITIITTSVLGDNLFGGILGLNVRVPSLISSVAAVVLLLIVSGAYYIYMWSRMGGATVGMKVMKISVRDASSGAPVSQGAAINRWLLVGAPFAVYPLYQWSMIGWLVSLLVLAYLIYLLVTIAQSATRQGFHDTYAKTVVAKG